MVKLKDELHESQLVTERVTGFTRHPQYAGEIWKRSFLSPFQPTEFYVPIRAGKKKTFTQRQALGNMYINLCEARENVWLVPIAGGVLSVNRC